MRRSAPRLLFNCPTIEIWPGGLLRARRSSDARLLARATHVLRRKSDGRFLAAQTASGLVPLLEHAAREPGFAEAIAHISHANGSRHVAATDAGVLPLDRLAQRLHGLGLDEGYGERCGLNLVPEPRVLAFAGFDRFGRALWLSKRAASAWRRMREAARSDGIVLDAISGWRSHDYQLGIFARKLARGQSIDQILAVNAAPGYSEHHGGGAIDIGTPGNPPAEESFERTPAFAWLQRRAADFGFVLSYPRDNPHGIVYEPWHWCWRPPPPPPPTPLP